jgi:diphthamide biosynthesis methyltransferase
MTGIDKLKPKIGTLVYVVIPQKFVVVPARVVEKMTRETIDGLHTTYVLDFGEQNQERISSDKITDGIIVADSEDAYIEITQHMQLKARDVVKKAVDKGNQRFGLQQNIQNSVNDVVSNVFENAAIDTDSESS